MTRPSHHHGPDHAPEPYAHHDAWPMLATDQHVALVNERGWRLSGKVETLTNDRQCLWIQLDAGMGRQLIHHQDGFMLESGSPAQPRPQQRLPDQTDIGRLCLTPVRACTH